MKNKEMIWRRGEHETINHVWRKRAENEEKNSLCSLYMNSISSLQ